MSSTARLVGAGVITTHVTVRWVDDSQTTVRWVALVAAVVTLVGAAASVWRELQGDHRGATVALVVCYVTGIVGSFGTIFAALALVAAASGRPPSA